MVKFWSKFSPMSLKDIIAGLGGGEEDQSEYSKNDGTNYSGKLDHALRSAAHSPQHKKRLKRTLGINVSGELPGETSFRMANEENRPD